MSSESEQAARQASNLSVCLELSLLVLARLAAVAFELFSYLVRLNSNRLVSSLLFRRCRFFFCFFSFSLQFFSFFVSPASSLSFPDRGSRE